MLSYCFLPRTIIEISGTDAFLFTQSLITQDIYLLNSQSSIFTLLLTNTGRYFLDFFIIKNNNTLLIDIATSEVDLLLNLINRYKLRSKIEVKIIPSLKVVSIFFSPKYIEDFNKITSINHKSLFHTTKNIIIPDNRTHDLGLRVITTNKNLSIKEDFLSIIKTYFNLPQLPNLVLVNLTHYTIKRYKLAVPENTELIKEKSIPLECNFEELNAISFNKGCYLGQEFTNSSKRILIIRKKIISFTFNKKVDFSNILKTNSEIINQENQKVGTVLAICQTYLLALINIESVINKNCFYVSNTEITPIVPYWLKNLIRDN